MKRGSSTHGLTWKASILSALGNLNSHSGVWSILAARHAKTRLFDNLCTREKQSMIIQERGKSRKCGQVSLCQTNMAVIKRILIKPKKPALRLLNTGLYETVAGKLWKYSRHHMYRTDLCKVICWIHSS